jgi:anti-anti-sigma factor
MIRVRLNIPADNKFLEQVRGFVRQLLEGLKFPEEDIQEIELAIDEIIANIIEHGYGLNQDKSIVLIMHLYEEKCKITIKDKGNIFDLSKADEIDLPRHITQGKGRGLGVYLVKKVMDSLRYHVDEEGYNCLTMTKNLRYRGKIIKKLKVFILVNMRLGVIALKLEGFLDLDTVPEGEKVFNWVQNNIYNKVIVDLEKLIYISSAGMGIFITNVKKLRDLGGDMVFVRPSSAVANVFKLLGFYKLFKITETYEDAYKAFDDR